MTQYLYPQNLKAKANLWLWGLRDFTILCVAILLSAVVLVHSGILLPAAVSLCFGFLTIRAADETTIMDYLRCCPTPTELKGDTNMNYSMEEINLMCIYDCTSRSALIDNLEEAAEYVYDPDMLKLIDQTIEKLQHTTDAEFAVLPLVPAWDDVETEDTFNE